VADSYLAICAIYRDEAPYLREWIEFHRLVGVERFFLYNNGSIDDNRSVLAPYEEEEIVVRHEWLQFPGWMSAYMNCITEHREEARWLAVIDIDEFLFTPSGPSLPQVLAEYEDRPGIGVNRATYGTSGHTHPPAGLVVESYVRRMSERYPASIKSIVDPRRVRRVVNPHCFRYDEGLAVDEHKHEIEGWFTSSLTFDRLRLNHYWTKSEEECERKFDRIRPGRPPRPWPGRPDRELQERANEVFDDVLAPYADRIRAAIDRSPAEA
jgi:Glycosyltransferase family 92